MALNKIKMVSEILASIAKWSFEPDHDDFLWTVAVALRWKR